MDRDKGLCSQTQVKLLIMIQPFGARWNVNSTNHNVPRAKYTTRMMIFFFQRTIIFNFSSEMFLFTDINFNIFNNLFLESISLFSGNGIIECHVFQALPWWCLVGSAEVIIAILFEEFMKKSRSPVELENKAKKASHMIFLP